MLVYKLIDRLLRVEMIGSITVKYRIIFEVKVK